MHDHRCLHDLSRTAASTVRGHLTLIELIEVGSKGEPVSLKIFCFSLILTEPLTVLIVMLPLDAARSRMRVCYLLCSGAAAECVAVLSSPTQPSR